MSAPDFILLLCQLAVMLGCGLASGVFARRFGQPAVLGELVGGILIGPTIAGTLVPLFLQTLFPIDVQVDAARSAIIRFGMLVFLFSIGLEIDLGLLYRQGRAAILVGLIGTLLPMGCGIALAYAWPSIWGDSGGVGSFGFAIYIGACLANSANPVLARLLYDLGLLRQRVGSIIMSATVIDDLIGWSVLGAVVAHGEGEQAAGATLSEGDASAWSAVGVAMLTMLLFTVGILVVGRWLVAPALDRIERSAGPSGQTSGLIGTAMLLILLSGALAEYLKIHAFLGPFLLGIGLASSRFADCEPFKMMTHFVLATFVPIYFVSSGLTCNFIANFDGLLVLVLLVSACLSKFVGCTFAGRLAGLDWRVAAGIACGMNARGALGVILAGIGRDNGLINEPTYVALVIMALGTTLMAGPLMAYFLAPEARQAAIASGKTPLPTGF